MPIQELSPNFEAAVGVEANAYQYNNKELNEDFGLQWMHYGARWYNPQINRWGQIDPLAEKYYAWNGYNYVGNNPIAFIDPNGRYKFPAGKDYSNYKKFTSYLSNNLSEILQSSNIMGGLQKFGQLSTGAIENMIKPDSGPVVEIIDDIPFRGAGYYTGGKNGKIQISRSLVEGLESASEEDVQAHLLLVISTLLHESVHYGDWQDGDPDDNTETFYKMVEIDGESFPRYLGSEKGHLFESEVYRNGEWQTTIENLDDAKTVIEQKSQTQEGLKDLPTIPK